MNKNGRIFFFSSFFLSLLLFVSAMLAATSHDD